MSAQGSTAEKQDEKRRIVSNKLRIPLPFDQTMEAVLKVKPEPKPPKKRPEPKSTSRQKAK
jgi:hypothetical protein